LDIKLASYLDVNVHFQKLKGRRKRIALKTRTRIETQNVNGIEIKKNKSKIEEIDSNDYGSEARHS